jgi:hypothetical protein
MKSNEEPAKKIANGPIQDKEICEAIMHQIASLREIGLFNEN